LKTKAVPRRLTERPTESEHPVAESNDFQVLISKQQSLQKQPYLKKD